MPALMPKRIPNITISNMSLVNESPFPNSGIIYAEDTSLALQNLSMEAGGYGVYGKYLHDSTFENIGIRRARRGIIDKWGERNIYPNVYGLR